MGATRGYALFQRVAERILAGRLGVLGYRDVAVSSAPGDLGRAVDLSAPGLRPVRVKVKSDPYFGDDPALVRDREFPFYRGASDTLALEAIADAGTRVDGWAVSSDADELWYYRLAIAAPEADVAALFNEPDQVFFAELPVAADDLIVMPMAQVTAWFSENMGRFPSRPVTGPDGSSWQRLVPRDTLVAAVSGVQHVGPVFADVAARSRG